jgi:hypothetical protein
MEGDIYNYSMVVGPHDPRIIARAMHVLGSLCYVSL